MPSKKARNRVGLSSPLVHGVERGKSCRIEW